MFLNKSAVVRDTCARVAAQSQTVKIVNEKVEEFADQLFKDFQENKIAIQKYQAFECHLSQVPDKAQLINYVFVLDSLNFCFWPTPLLEYEHLAGAIKKASQETPQILTPPYLARITEQEVKDVILGGQNFPQIAERTRILNQIGQVTVEYFGGDFYNILKEANGSAVKLVFLLTSYFNEFQDTAIYRGEQICFYKRPQILVGDLFDSLYAIDELAKFRDINEITMFPDYRVPQVLRQQGVFWYSEDLEQKILAREQLPSGSEYEVEIRANTVHAVELLKAALEKRGKKLMSIEIDWLLWQVGEKTKDSIFPHHRVLTIFY